MASLRVSILKNTIIKTSERILEMAVMLGSTQKPKIDENDLLSRAQLSQYQFNRADVGKITLLHIARERFKNGCTD